MVVRGRRSELAALHDTKRVLNSRGGESSSDVSSVSGSAASKVSSYATSKKSLLLIIVLI